MIGPYNNCPIYTIDLGKLYEASQICELMKSKQITHYVYIFTCTRGVVKYGYSADNSRTYGDRIYRQAGHLDGWNRKLGGSSGSDMRIIAENYQNKYNETLDRNNMQLVIIDLSNYDVPESLESHCKNLERMLIDDSVDRHGSAPIGNIDNVTESTVRRHKNTKQLEKFFEFIN
jgi:hypothetical protein